MMIRAVVVVLLAAAVAGCEMADVETAVQAVAGPSSVTVTAPVAGQQLVTWSADPDPRAFKYYVFQSTNGGAFAFLASVLNPSAAPPAPTTYTATGLSGGAQYCYAIESAYADGTMSALGPAGCGAATGDATSDAPPIYITLPSRLFASAGDGMLISTLDLLPGSRVVATSIAAQCPTLGYIVACARVREGGAWTWCSQAVACASAGAANVPMPPVIVDDLHHLDIGLQSGPSAAVVALGVVTLR